MTRAVSKKSAAKKEVDEQEKCPPWVNGIMCALNVTLDGPDFAPSIAPPVSQYLQEVALGMTGGEGDPSSQGVPEGPRRIGSKPSAVHRMRALAPIMKSQASFSTCQALFWLVLGGIFETLPEEGLAKFRKSLGESWYAITLQTFTSYVGDRDLQDVVLSALPYAYAQAIYRMFVDGFVEDRSLYVKHGDMFLLKASQIVLFEVTGFQPTPETIRRGRHRVFMRRVVCSPHVDQQEFLKGKKRQEMLESHSAGTQDRPLQFGDVNGNPLEESQLDHCLFASDQQRRQVEQLMAEGKQAWELDTTPVPEHLSVARYYDLKSGHMILDGQLKTLRKLLATEVVEEEPPIEMPAESVHPSEPPSPTYSSWQGGSPSGDESPSFGEYVTEADEPESPTGESGNKERHKKLWRKGMVAARFQIAKEAARLKKDKEAKAKKLRAETIARKICDDSLPRHLCARALNTAWVSPPYQHLSNVYERKQVLNKTATDDFQLTMDIKGELPLRPLSTPLPVKRKPLRKRQLESHLGLAGIATSGSRGGEESSVGSVRGGATMMFPGTLSNSQSAPVLPRMATTTKGSSVSKGESGGLAQLSSAAAMLPRVAATMGAKPGDKAVSAASVLRGEVLSMEPPPRPPKDVVLRRTQEHLMAHEKNSFALYAAEHDMYTGAKKTRIDAKGLHDEEAAYCKLMDSLVGGKPKRLIAPEGVGTRHLKDK